MITLITYKADMRWPLASVVLFMIYAAEDAYGCLWSHYNDIETWIKAGRVGPKPQLPNYDGQ